MTNFSQNVEAIEVPFDNGPSGLTATSVQDALVELDLRSVFLRSRILSANLTIPTDYFAIWHRMQVLNTATLRLSTGSRLRAIG